MTVVRFLTIAAVDTPHGAWCRETGGGGWLPTDPDDGQGGVSAGPYTRLGYTPAGEPLRIQVEGPIMMAVANGQLGHMVDLKDGRVLG